MPDGALWRVGRRNEDDHGRYLCRLEIPMNMSVILTIAAVVWLEMLRRKDIYVLLILLATLLFALLSFDIFNLHGIAAYVKDIGLSFSWLFAWILAVVMGARQLPTEEKQGTIYTLLAKPISRAELLIGKWLGAWSITVAATLCFYSLIIAVALFRNSGFPPPLLLQAVLLHAAALSVVCSLALAFSTRMNADAASAICFVITGSAMVFLPRIPDLMRDLDGAHSALMTFLYCAMPHFEVFDLRQRLVYDATPARWSIVGMIIAYAALMTGAVMILAWLGYRNKKFVRGGAA
jgi:Cu-processing system permease protein